MLDEFVSWKAEIEKLWALFGKNRWDVSVCAVAGFGNCCSIIRYILRNFSIASHHYRWAEKIFSHFCELDEKRKNVREKWNHPSGNHNFSSSQNRKKWKLFFSSAHLEPTNWMWTHENVNMCRRRCFPFPSAFTSLVKISLFASLVTNKIALCSFIYVCAAQHCYEMRLIGAQDKREEPTRNMSYERYCWHTIATCSHPPNVTEYLKYFETF